MKTVCAAVLGGCVGTGMAFAGARLASAMAQTVWAAAAILAVGIGIGILLGYRLGRWRCCKSCLYRKLWDPENPFAALKAAMASWESRMSEDSHNRKDGGKD